jgi:hypothetical protein
MDRFIFTIKLADVVSHAEKSLYLAVRYSIPSHEIWDNNSGQIYHIQIVREKVPKANKETVIEKPQESSLADLLRQLEQVVKPDHSSETVGGILARHSRRRLESPSPTPSPPRRDPTLGFKPQGSLAA